MRESELVYMALDNLEKNTLVMGEWYPNAGNEADGEVRLVINKHRLKYYAEVKNELRNNQLYQILKLKEKYEHLLVVATHIFPKIKDELRLHNVAYLEANGNVFLKNEHTFLWIETAKPFVTEPPTGSRAFTKTGLKVLFYFLANEGNINKTYRQIAEHTGTTIGNINKIITGLKQDGFVMPAPESNYSMAKKQELLDKWVAAYDVKLKPAAKIGSFRFVHKDDFRNWEGLALKNGSTLWGGEAAGALFTKYLKPEILTLYTNETRVEIIKNYRLVPDNGGNVVVYEKWWKDDGNEKQVVPALIAYTDLINTGEGRCIETAQKIYNDVLAEQF